MSSDAHHTPQSADKPRRGRRGRNGRRRHRTRSKATTSSSQPGAASTTGEREPDQLEDAIRRSSTKDLARRAEQARRSRKFNEANRLFEAVLARDPRHLEALCGKACLLLELNEYRASLEFFERALEVAPKKGRAIYGAAMAHVELEQYEQAASYAYELQALGDVKNVESAHRILGRVFFGQGLFEDAVQELKEGIGSGRRRGQRGWGTHRRHRFLLAQGYIELNRLGDAARELEWLLSDDWSRSIQDQLGWLYLDLDRPEDAQAAFQCIIDKAQRDTRALVGLGRSHLARNDYTGAIKAFKRVLQIDDNNLQALDGMAEAHKGAGDLDRAAGYVERLRSVSRLPPALLEQRLRSLEQERRRRDAELLRVRNIAALNVMATGIAHELRQPLSVIRLAAQNAQLDLETGDTGQVTSDLADIDANVGKIDRIVEILRDISRAEGDETTSVRLDQVVDRALTLFRTQFRNRDIELTLRDLETSVLADPVALEQVFINLLSNARDAVSAADVKRIRIWAVPGSGAGGGRTWIYFKDTGAGMTPDVRRRAMEPFYSTKEVHGTGMGLWVSFNLMRRMGGQLGIKESTPKKGTTVELVLPCEVEHDGSGDEDPGG